MIIQYSLWDELDLYTEEGYGGESYRPLWTVDIHDEHGLLMWLKMLVETMRTRGRNRMLAYTQFDRLYRNSRIERPRRDYASEADWKSAREPRHRVNWIYDLVETKVAYNAKLKHNLAFVPVDDEPQDIANAKIAKAVYDNYSEMHDLELLHQEADRIMFKYGHVFQLVDWDDEAGPEKGGKPLGEVRVRNYHPGFVMVEPGRPRLKDARWALVTDIKNIFEMRDRYPGINFQHDANWEDYFGDFRRSPAIREDSCLVHTLLHRPVPSAGMKGRKVVFTTGGILSDEPLECQDGMLPLVDDRDVEEEGEFWGRSFLVNVEQMQRFYNNIQASQATDYAFFGRTKILLPKGACSVDDLENGGLVLEWTGDQPPSVMAPTYTPPQSMELQDRLERLMKSLARVSDISKGDVPPGITANSALRFLDEQVGDMMLPAATKRRRRVVRLARKILQEFHRGYSGSHERTVRMVGADNEILIQSMKGVDFGRVHDIRPLNSSEMPDTKAGKMAWMMDLQAMFPQEPFFSKEQAAQLLDLASDRSFKNRTTGAAILAETALGNLINGEEPPEPLISDDLQTHHERLASFVQGPQFRTLKRERRKGVVAHTKAVEMLMFERAMKSGPFAQALAANTAWPLFFEPELPLAKVVAGHMQDSQGAPQGAPGGAPNPQAARDMLKNANPPDQQPQA